MYLACSACKLQYDVSSYNEGTRVRCKCGEVLTVPSQQVKSICCATCGASVPTNSTQCPYCKGAVRRAVCPSCFRGLREDAKFCDSCGEAIRPHIRLQYLGEGKLRYKPDHFVWKSEKHWHWWDDGAWIELTRMTPDSS